MLRYLAFAPIGADPVNPIILGAVEVPGCFEPNDLLIDAAEARGLDLFIIEGAGEPLPAALVNMGKRLLDRCRELSHAHLN